VKIAVAGKGGTGKSFIAACLARQFAMYARRNGLGGQVYAVDADPAGGLGAALGISQSDISGIRPIIDMREFIDTGDDDGALYLSDPGAVNVDGQFKTIAEGVNFLRMAGVKRAGAGCYCHEYNFLQALLHSILLGERDTLILDMGAGVEHLARGTIRGADVLLIVSEATRACIEVTKTIRTLGAELGIRHIYVVANNIRSEKEELLIRASFRRGELIGLVRMSEAVADMAIGVGAGRGQSTLKPGTDIEELFFNIQTITMSGM